MKNFGPRNLVTVAVVTAFLVTGVTVGIGDDPEVALANGCEASGAASGYGGGTGASGDPYLITNTAEILRLAATSSDWAQHFEQTRPVNLTGCTWTPIGNSTDKFIGSFDGGGNTITGLTVSPSSLTHVGMFGYVEGATIQRVVLSGVSVSGGTDRPVGGLVGHSNSSTISASSVTGVVTATGEESAVGGLVGRNSGGTIRGSSAHGEVNGESKAGGLVGRNQDGAEIVDSHATGNVTASDSQAGGLVGFNNSMILRSYATGNVTVSASVTDGNVGGLVGFHSDPGKIIDSYALGDVTGPRRVGGLVGFAFNGDIAPEISNSYSVGAVTGSAPTGGLVGEKGGVVTITASFWDESTSGMTSSAGGVGVTTDVMKTFATYDQAGWEIANKWQLPVAGGPVWGVCKELNNGYPFLLWQFRGDQVPVSCGGTPQSPGDSGNGTVVLPEPTPVTTTPVTTLPSQPAPAAVGGVLPQNAPGEVTVFEDGQPVSVEVTVADAVQLVVRALTFELRLSAECSLGCPIIATPDGRQVLELQADGSARVEGEGFLPESTVDVWLFSDPRYLGQLTADANGRFSGTVALGEIGVGEHTLQVNAVSPTGAQRSVNLGVVVTASESTPLETLPSAGAEPWGLWMLAMALLGIGLILTVRRRPIPN